MSERTKNKTFRKQIGGRERISITVHRSERDDKPGIGSYSTKASAQYRKEEQWMDSGWMSEIQSLILGALCVRADAYIDQQKGKDWAEHRENRGEVPEVITQAQEVAKTGFEDY